MSTNEELIQKYYEKGYKQLPDNNKYHMILRTFIYVNLRSWTATFLDVSK